MGMKQVLINIDVPDLTAALSFYREGLGLTLGRRFGDAGVELLGLSSPLYLLEKKAGTPPFPNAGSTRSYERHWCPVHLDVIVDDIQLATEKLTTLGAILEIPQKNHVWGKITQFQDPFGNGICLIEFVGRGYDEISAAPARDC